MYFYTSYFCCNIQNLFSLRILLAAPCPLCIPVSVRCKFLFLISCIQRILNERRQKKKKKDNEKITKTLRLLYFFFFFEKICDKKYIHYSMAP